MKDLIKKECTCGRIFTPSKKRGELCHICFHKTLPEHVETVKPLARSNYRRDVETELPVITHIDPRKYFIKSCRRKGYNRSKIAKFLGVSKQRIDQIIRPDKHSARRLANKAYTGVYNCEFPECVDIGEAHHPDYSRPLDVIWLCRTHHSSLHKVMRGNEEREDVAVVRRCSLCGTVVSGKRRFCDDCKRKKMTKRLRKLYRTSPQRREAVKRYTKSWAERNPEKYKEILNRAMKRYIGRHREELLAKAKERYKDPVYRRKMLDAQKAYRLRKKESKAAVLN